MIPGNNKSKLFFNLNKSLENSSLVDATNKRHCRKHRLYNHPTDDFEQF